MLLYSTFGQTLERSYKKEPFGTIINGGLGLSTCWIQFLSPCQRVLWTAKKNEWVLNKAGVKRELLDTEGSETERLLLRPHACGIVYLLTSNFTGRRQHLSNAVLELFYLTGASLNICK